MKKIKNEWMKWKKEKYYKFITFSFCYALILSSSHLWDFTYHSSIQPSHLKLKSIFIRKVKNYKKEEEWKKTFNFQHYCLMDFTCRTGKHFLFYILLFFPIIFLLLLPPLALPCLCLSTTFRSSTSTSTPLLKWNCCMPVNRRRVVLEWCDWAGTTVDCYIGGWWDGEVLFIMNIVRYGIVLFLLFFSSIFHILFLISRWLSTKYYPSTPFPYLWHQNTFKLAASNLDMAWLAGWKGVGENGKWIAYQAFVPFREVFSRLGLGDERRVKIEIHHIHILLSSFISFRLPCSVQVLFLLHHWSSISGPYA